MDEDSSYFCSVQIRQALYGILLSMDKDLCTNYPKKDVSRKTHVEEYDRERKDLKKRLIPPLFNLPDDIVYPCLSQIPEMSAESRTQAFLAFLGVDDSILCDVNPSLHVSVCALFYWVMHASPKVTVQHVQALLVCMIKLSVIDRTIRTGRSFYVPALGQLTESEGTDEGTPVSSHSQYSMEECESAHERLQKFQPSPKHNNACKLDVTMLHAFAQYHACLRDAIYLNQILLEPLMHAEPALVFNGTFLYNFSKELCNRKCPDLYIQEQLGRNSTLTATYLQLYGMVMDKIPAERFLKEEEVSFKKSKKRGSKGSKAATVPATPTTADGETGEATKECKLNVNAACALTNRYGALCESDSDSV